MVKVFCNLSVDKYRYETDLRKRVLLKGILKKNIAQGVVPVHEEEERWDKITKTLNHMIRLQLKVTS